MRILIKVAILSVFLWPSYGNAIDIKDGVLSISGAKEMTSIECVTYAGIKPLLKHPTCYRISNKPTQIVMSEVLLNTLNKYFVFMEGHYEGSRGFISRIQETTWWDNVSKTLFGINFLYGGVMADNDTIVIVGDYK